MTDRPSPIEIPGGRGAVRCQACGALYRWDFTRSPLVRVCTCPRRRA